MRNCPHCFNTAVIEDGYCGVCRQCTLPPVAPAQSTHTTDAEFKTVKCPLCDAVHRLFNDKADRMQADFDGNAKLVESLIWIRDAMGKTAGDTWCTIRELPGATEWAENLKVLANLARERATPSQA